MQKKKSLKYFHISVLQKFLGQCLGNGSTGGSVDSVNWECGAERLGRGRMKALPRAQGNFWNDTYAHFLDYGDRFMGIYMCQDIQLYAYFVYNILNIK